MVDGFSLCYCEDVDDRRRRRFVGNYRMGTVNSKMVNSKFHLIQSFCEIFSRFLSFHVYNA